MNPKMLLNGKFIFAFVIPICAAVALWFEIPTRHPCDDNVYLISGGSYSNYTLTSNFGPFYVLWHSALQLFVSENSAYILNYRLLAFFLPVVLSAFVWSKTKRTLITLLICIIVALSFSNLTECPRISAFALIWIFGGLLLIGVPVNYFRAVCLLGLLGLSASYIRPEYFLSFVVMLSMVVSHLAHSRARLSSVLRREGVFAFTLGLYVLLAFYWFGNPMHHPRYNRSLEAFGQGYAVNVSSANPERTLAPYQDWERIVAEDFGVCEGFFRCALNNPNQALWHLQSNIRMIPSMFTAAFSIDLSRLHIRFPLPRGLGITLFLSCVILTIISLSRQKILWRQAVRSPQNIFLLVCVITPWIGLLYATPFPRHAFSSLLAAFALLVSIHWCGQHKRLEQKGD
jgi:hypothetical protein